MDLKFTHSHPCLPLQGLVFFPIQMLGGWDKGGNFLLICGVAPYVGFYDTQYFVCLVS